MHPASAISAFLAAAFILTIDGVKATDIGQVLFNAAQDKLIDGDAGLTGWNYSQRSEPLKGMFSELNFSNFNVAILGAALIADEIYQTDAELSLRQEIVANSITFSGGKNQASVSGRDSVVVNGEYKSNRLEERDAATSTDKPGLKIVMGGEESESGTKVADSDVFKEESITISVPSEINGGEVAVLAMNIKSVFLELFLD